MVIHDHRLDLGNPARHPSCRQVLARDRDRWTDVVERIVGPDTQIVEDRGDRDLLELDAAVPRDGEAQVHDPVDVIPIGSEIVPELRCVKLQNVFDGDRSLSRSERAACEESVGRALSRGKSIDTRDAANRARFSANPGGKRLR